MDIYKNIIEKLPNGNDTLNRRYNQLAKIAS